ncbi:hypothetical protein B0H14DRAFT_2580792 [Mycena olivaceomarginata]|nr:hypothetical protein B0H14DRAFT_2580792 [Mycena olivaceomarginata]
MSHAVRSIGPPPKSLVGCYLNGQPPSPLQYFQPQSCTGFDQLKFPAFFWALNIPSTSIQGEFFNRSALSTNSALKIHKPNLRNQDTLPTCQASIFGTFAALKVTQRAIGLLFLPPKHAELVHGYRIHSASHSLCRKVGFGGLMLYYQPSQFQADTLGAKHAEVLVKTAPRSANPWINRCRRADDQRIGKMLRVIDGLEPPAQHYDSQHTVAGYSPLALAIIPTMTLHRALASSQRAAQILADTTVVPEQYFSSFCPMITLSRRSDNPACAPHS